MSPTITHRFDTLRVHLAEEDQLLEVVLDRPKGNVLDSRMMGEISAVLDDHRKRRELKLVVLRGAGGHFSYGASIEEHRKDQAPAMLATFHRLIRRVAAFPVPVAALVEGQCLGGGFELVLVCHFVFATPDARFGCPEIKLGVFPPVLAAIGARRLGGFTAERLLLSGDPIGADQNERLGMVHRVLTGTDPRGELLAWFRETLKPLSAFALRQGTRALRQATGFLAELEVALEATERLYLDEVLPSHDGNEGIEAFLARRPPMWRSE